jgi:palmitoyltransferase
MFGQKLNHVTHISEELYYKCTTIEFFIIFAVGFAILCLASLNGYIISRGATNIELKNMNIPCISSTSDMPKNPYDLGFVNNWKVFLGFDDLKSFFFKVVLPSAHKPLTDGVNWSEYLNYPIRHMNKFNKEFPV